MLKMNKKDRVQSELEINEQEKNSFIKKKTLKDLIAPAGIDATHTNHLEIISTKTRYARSMLVSAIPRMCTFPEFLRGMYTFGDANISVFITPKGENSSQTELNRTINELESERIVALQRGCLLYTSPSPRD